ncbi:hypothetical protein [Mesorhizobium sp. WSM3873]|uniref:hypothetical protein n=2 Tax=unclassified Mesorhizobium TaxID=325217 RepID=UPI000800712D|nr:hypothetical protein [Mesorhizobium sp. WSM3873]OBQ83595.1 hypothetical protein A9K71_23825 [Mesorhizobium sp. WSM3873]
MAEPDWVDRLFFWISPGIEFEGLRIGALDGDSSSEVFRRVKDAIQLIKTYDVVRFRMVVREIARIWIRLLPGHSAAYRQDKKMCLLDRRFVLSSQPEFIASAIIHEATHGRLIRWKIGYTEDVRHRVEMACVRRELAFAGKMPNAETLVAQTKAILEYGPEVFSNEAMTERSFAGEIEAARGEGIPD